MSESVDVEKQMLELSQLEWSSLPDIGRSYNPQVQKEVYFEFHMVGAGRTLKTILTKYKNNFPCRDLTVSY